MANNPYNNRVELADGTVLMDLTEDTITPKDLALGVTAHDRSGAAITGTQKGFVYYGTCSTAADTQAKTVTIDGITAYYEGLNVRILFINEQTFDGNPTLNINSLGTKSIGRYSGVNIGKYGWHANEIVDLVYDGTKFVLVDAGLADLYTFGVVRLMTAVNSSVEDGYAASPKSVKLAYDAIPAASTSTPSIDYGSGSPGSSSNYSKADHSHPAKVITSIAEIGLSTSPSLPTMKQVSDAMPDGSILICPTTSVDHSALGTLGAGITEIMIIRSSKDRICAFGFRAFGSVTTASTELYVAAYSSGASVWREWKKVLLSTESNGALAIGNGGTGAITAADALTNLGAPARSDIYSMMSIVNHAIATGVSMNAGTYSDGTATVTKAGYFPIGICGIRITGTGSPDICINNFWLSSVSSGSATISYRWKNFGTVNRTNIGIAASVLWIKET